MSKILSELLNKIRGFYSFLSLLLLSLSVFIIILLTGYWKKPNKVITADVQGYYMYLPAFFIYHDITTLSIPFDIRKKHFGVMSSPLDIPVFKFTMGLSLLYAPFFLLADGYARLAGLDATGFGPPYAFALLMSSYFFFVMGLIYLRRLMLRYFSDKVTAITLITVVIGTNMLYYAGVRAALSHIYSFTFFVLFMDQTLKWYRNPSFSRSVIVGLLTGIISLLRPSNILIITFFIFYDIKNVKDLAGRWRFYLSKYRQLLVIILFALPVWIPQMVYWKITTGSLLYYSYGTTERFFFNNPQILNSLFSYHNGWLLYSPVMIFALMGLIVLYRRKRSFFWPVFIFTVLNIYVLSSWWCWWFVGFGNRAYIESYALLAFPFASLIDYMNEKRKKILRIIFYPILLFLLFLSVFQNWQYAHNMGHFDGMTKESYWYLFLNPKPHGKHYRLLARPDYKKAKQGVYEFKKSP